MSGQIDPQEETLRGALENVERVSGPRSFETATQLDQLAAYLRGKGKTLDAVNLEARAKKIRSDLGIPESAASSAAAEETWGSKEKSEKVKITTISLAALFALSFVFRELGIPLLKGAGYLCSALAWLILDRSGHPFDTPPIKFGIPVVWLAILFLIPGMHGN